MNERKPDMKKVVTVTGEIKPEELGFTDMHEHIPDERTHFQGAVQRGTSGI